MAVAHEWSIDYWPSSTDAKLGHAHLGGCWNAIATAGGGLVLGPEGSIRSNRAATPSGHSPKAGERPGPDARRTPAHSWQATHLIGAPPVC